MSTPEVNEDFVKHGKFKLLKKRVNGQPILDRRNMSSEHENSDFVTPSKRTRIVNVSKVVNQNVSDSHKNSMTPVVTLLSQGAHLNIDDQSETTDTVPQKKSSVRNLNSCKVLPSLTTMKTKNVELFLHFFQSTILARRNARHGINEEDLPHLHSFSNNFRNSTNTETCGLERQMRIANVSRDTIRRAAASAVFFLSFTWHKRSELFPAHDKKENFSVAVEEKLKTMSTCDKSSVIVQFMQWYDAIPPMRTSAIKFLAANATPCRANVKEAGTMLTVVRGLMAYFTYVGIIAPSRCHQSTEESKQVWSSVKTAIVNGQKRKAGQLDLNQSSITTRDLLALMEVSEGCRNMFELQSWLLAIVLSGSGLRIGSIRQRHNSSKLNSSASTVEVSEGEEDTDMDELDITFDCLKCSSVRVFRQKSEEDDPDGTIRLRVELKITSTKTTGQRLFAPQCFGYSYPHVQHTGELDWSPNTAIALTMLSVMGGATKISTLLDTKVVSENSFETEVSQVMDFDPPLFRTCTSTRKLEATALRNDRAPLRFVADQLKLPYPLFTSRAYRRGYAKSVLESVVLRESGIKMISRDRMKQALHASAQWQSNQADTYINNIVDAVKAHRVSEVGTTADDWISSLFHCSASARYGYHHLSYDITNRDLALDETLNVTEEQLSRLTNNQKRQFIDALNVKHWKSCSNADFNATEQRKHLSRAFPMNVKKTFESLRLMMKSDSNGLPFCGMGLCQQDRPYRCPVLNCSNPNHATIEMSNVHWTVCHEDNKYEERYLCSACPEAGVSKWRFYLRHINRRAPQEQIRFVWN